tara:strand:- start:39 stop:437 length:399 start_codon:yes stop_codon:yes gene_type:complete
MSHSCPKCKAGPSYVKPLCAAGDGTSYICRSCNATWPDEPNHVNEVSGMKGLKKDIEDRVIRIEDGVVRFCREEFEDLTFSKVLLGLGWLGLFVVFALWDRIEPWLWIQLVIDIIQHYWKCMAFEIYSMTNC